MELLPLNLIEKSFSSSFKFHLNLLFKSNQTKSPPSFYQEIVFTGKNILLW